jgi:hypothetical protein
MSKAYDRLIKPDENIYTPLIMPVEVERTSLTVVYNSTAA